MWQEQRTYRTSLPMHKNCRWYTWFPSNVDLLAVSWLVSFNYGVNFPLGANYLFCSLWLSELVLFGQLHLGLAKVPIQRYGAHLHVALLFRIVDPLSRMIKVKFQRRHWFCEGRLQGTTIIYYFFRMFCIANGINRCVGNRVILSATNIPSMRHNASATST